MAADPKEVVEKYYTPIRRHFDSKFDHAIAHDLVHETLRRVLEYKKPIENERAFVFTVARRVAIDHLRRKYKTSTGTFDSAVMSPVDVGTRLSTKVSRRELLMNALKSLPWDEEEAYLHRYGEEMKLDEIAEVMGKSLATVKRKIAAAQEKLEAKFAEMLKPGETLDNLAAAAYRQQDV